MIWIMKHGEHYISILYTIEIILVVVIIVLKIMDTTAMAIVVDNRIVGLVYTLTA